MRAPKVPVCVTMLMIAGQAFAEEAWIAQGFPVDAATLAEIAQAAARGVAKI